MEVKSRKPVQAKRLSCHSGQFLILQTVHGSKEYPFQMIHLSTRLHRTMMISQSLPCRKIDVSIMTELATEILQLSKIFLFFILYYLQQDYFKIINE